MYKILMLDNISEAGLKYLPPESYKLSRDENEPDAVIVRSHNMKEMTFGSSLLAVVRAGAGVNNIPVEEYTKKGIVVFNTPGANANAVKELVLAGLLMTSRRILEGFEWVESIDDKENAAVLAEKEKKRFAGPEIYGKTLSVIGLGAVGVLVANSAAALGMDVIGYDPFLSPEHKENLSSSVKLCPDIKEALGQSDYITVHVPLSDGTRDMFDSNLFTAVKEGARLINFARGGIVNSKALLSALESGKISRYITDFPEAELIGVENVIVLPHLGASTPESEEHCAEMAVRELRNYIETGVIKNSVNFPNCISDRKAKARIAVIGENRTGLINYISDTISKHGLNINNLTIKSRKGYGSALIDLDTFGGHENELLNDIKSLQGVIRVRLIKDINV